MSFGIIENPKIQKYYKLWLWMEHTDFMHT